MITITPAAAMQIRVSAAQSNMEGMPMRIAATRNPDGSIHYGMGFDDNQLEDDTLVSSEDIEIVISESSKMLLDGLKLDYVELEPGAFQFIFQNPNDAHYVPPSES